MLSVKAREVQDEMKEVVDLFVKSQVDLGTFTTMSAEELAILAKCSKLLDDHLDLMVEEADKLDEIDRKLNELLRSK